MHASLIADRLGSGTLVRARLCLQRSRGEKRFCDAGRHSPSEPSWICPQRQ